MMTKVECVMPAKDVDAESELFSTLGSLREGSESAPSGGGASRETIARGKSHIRAEPQQVDNVSWQVPVGICSDTLACTSHQPYGIVLVNPLDSVLDSPSGVGSSIMIPIKTLDSKVAMF